jgi:hypothetical protein
VSSVPSGSLRGSGATTPLPTASLPPRATVSTGVGTATAVHSLAYGAGGTGGGVWDGSTAAPTLEETRRYIAAARALRPQPLTHAQAAVRVRDEAIAAGGVIAVPLPGV